MTSPHTNDPLPNAAPEKNKWSVGLHVVCVLDLLGQRERLQKWAKMPSGGAPDDEMIQAIKKTAGTVLSFREMFEEHFKAFNESAIDQRLKRQLPDNDYAKYLRTRSKTVQTQQFSDTFVFYAPLTTPHRDVTTIPLYSMLLACAIGVFKSLADKSPLRGAICIGTGTELSEHNFYGPALARAHQLESKVADYPRIVLSNELKRFLDSANRDTYSDDAVVDAVFHDAAMKCATLVDIDIDGIPILDYAGAGFRAILRGHSQPLPPFIFDAFQFAEAERIRFTNEGNPTLAKRYAHLCRYLGPRVPLWANLSSRDDPAQNAPVR